jgi:2-oxoglutarate dehydrogenase E2 component (dihydrolipoamide succinyltransferase)
MKVDVLMPEMGESIAEGTIAKWLKKPGDPVRKDESILEITTDKIDSEIPSQADGILVEVLVEEGTTVEVGALLARIETESAQSESVPEKDGEASAEKSSVPDQDEISISPVARNIAEEEGVTTAELNSIQGTGSRGRLTKSDLLGYLDQKKQRQQETVPTPQTVDSSASKEKDDLRIDEDVEIIEMSNMRRMIADHMVESKRTSPHTYTVAEVDMTRIVRYREKIKQSFHNEKGFKLTFTPFILHATVLALKAHPLVNSSVIDGKIHKKRHINLGVAVALESGLLVPVIKNAEEKNLLGLARHSYDLSMKAVNKKLTPADVQDGTFTVTNPGIWGNIFGLPIINQPQLGILGVGAIKKRPVVVDDAIAIRSMMYLSLSYDHRVIDGALAARFLQEIRTILEEYDTERAL